MKKIAVSSGLIVLGLCTAQAAGPAASLNEIESSKPWSVSATLRGFYDDNYTTSKDDKQDSFGLRISPHAEINIALEQTLLTAGYTFTANYFEDRDDGENEPWDYTHEFDFSLVHTFTERYMLQINDTFVSGQEPGLVDPDLGTTTRADGDNIRNTASIDFNIELTPLWSIALGYGNSYYNYEDDDGDFLQPSRSGLLDRVEHSPSLQLNRVLSPTTVGFVNYRFGLVCYTADEEIAPLPFPPFIAESSDRDSYSHSANLGVNHSFNQVLSGSLSAGARYTDYYKDPSGNNTSLSPEAMASLSYAYTTGGAAQLTFTHSLNQTDQVDPDGDGNLTMDSANSVLYGLISHPFTARLRGDLSGYVQWSTFNGGSADGDTETYYGADLKLTYFINRHLSCDVGYSYSAVDGVEGRGYNRNVFAIGIGAIY